MTRRRPLSGKVRPLPDDKVLQASHEFERLLPHFREIVNEMRDGHPFPYALVYEARRKLSRVVAALGAGVPAKSGHDWSDPK